MYDLINQSSAVSVSDSVVDILHFGVQLLYRLGADLKAVSEVLSDFIIGLVFQLMLKAGPEIHSDSSYLYLHGSGENAV